MSGLAAPTTRMTVDLPSSDYDALRISAVAAGRGQSMSSIVRRLVRLYLQAEAAEDDADIALAKARLADHGRDISDEEMQAHIARLLATQSPA